MGQITVFLPNSDKTYEEMFNLPSVGKELDDETIEALKNMNTIQEVARKRGKKVSEIL